MDSATPLDSSCAYDPAEKHIKISHNLLPIAVSLHWWHRAGVSLP